MLKLLGKASSINVRKVLWTCAELELSYDLEEWGLVSSDLQKQEFITLNPNGLVPVINDNGFVLWESNSICRYLASSREAEHLLPQNPKLKAVVEQWMDWQATELNTSWRYAFISLVRKHPDYKDANMVAESTQSWNANMQILEAQLQRTDKFLIGEHFTLADIVTGLSIHRWISTPIEKPCLPAINNYYERLSLREGFLKHGRNGIA